MIPAAIEKAKALYRFACASGSPLSEFSLVLTLGEAYELCDALALGMLGRCANHDQLCKDIALAKYEGDPWRVLAEWKLEGLSILSAEVLH